MLSETELDKRTRILFVHPKMSPFIQADLDLLKRHFEIRTVDLGGVKKNVAGVLRTIWQLARGTLWADLTFAWFAERHAKWMIRFSRILGRPSVVVIGGYEVAKVPEIGHGSLLDPKKAKMVKYILEHADKVIPVDESLKTDAVKNLGVDDGNIQTMHTGHDPEMFKPSGPKENMALSVGYVDKVTVKRKGLDVFVEAAKYLPEVKFVLVGSSPDGTLDVLKAKAPTNVEFAGFVAHDQLARYYQRAKVYCQLSMYEGLPNALCEAMLCECVPVGTDVSGIPTAMGDTGFYATIGDAKSAAEAIKKALVSNKGKDARARIKEKFSVENREMEMLAVIRRLLD
jgi:glycosyltransferase involved in cell wall biosynthesis